ncbi:Trypanosome variant surface glycoprotein C-terminal domain containing protein [Trypanosoma brucei equiperdum]|uniref:Trypanosome variant surface glycoprotein C-terminal domain containing protein n=1 Tax=Trypanosoma brucei equiperdum TaxID=630700 RepID=A0A3L6LAD2_9TRYP|nr:Trypanosome variant surface glycoprotein C-terminal domain containing protein [Trypanosoma brucei equiperdum]
MHPIIVLLWVLHATSRQCSAAEPQVSYTTKATTDCDELRFTEAIVQKLQINLENAENQVTNLAADAMAARLLACSASDPNAQLGFELTAALATAAIKRQIDENRQRRGASLEVIKTLKQRAGQLRTAMALVPGIKITKGTGTASTQTGKFASSSHGVCKIKLTAEGTKQKDCTDSSGKHAAIDAAAGALDKRTSLQLAKDERFKPLNYEIETRVAGTPNLGASPVTGPGYCINRATTYGNDAVGVGIEAVTRQADMDGLETVQLNKAGGTGVDGDCGNTDDENDNLLLSNKQIAHTLCKHKNHIITIHQSPLTQTGKQLTANSEAQKLAVLAIHGAYTGEESKETKEAAVKQLIGDGEQPLEKTFEQKLTKDQIEYTNGKTTTKETAKAALLSQTGHSTLVYCAGQMMRKIRQAAKQASLTASAPIDCSKIPQGKCSGKCEWEEKDGKGECKPKAGPENTAAGTGEGANAEGKKCSEKQTEGNCKDACKWDGKECN